MRLVGESGPIRERKDLIPRVATSPFPVVIEGESGTGKELIARALHEEGPRRAAVFVPVNGALLGHELFESELFGHARARLPPAPCRSARGRWSCPPAAPSSSTRWPS